MHSSFFNYRKQPGISDSDIDTESSGSDDNLTKEASLIEASFVFEDTQKPLVTGNSLGLTLTGNSKQLHSRYRARPTQRVTPVAESSSDDDEKGLLNKFNDECNEDLVDSLVDLDKKKSKYRECEDESSKEEDESLEEPKDESLIYHRQKKKTLKIISSESESDNNEPSPLRWKQLTQKSTVKPLVFGSGISEDEVVPTPPQKSKARTRAKCNVGLHVHDSKESSTNDVDQEKTSPLREALIETSSDDSFSPDDPRQSTHPSIIVESGSEDSHGNGKVMLSSIKSLEADDPRVSLISSDSEESHNKPTGPKLPTLVQKSTKDDIKPAETRINLISPPTRHQSHDLVDQVIDLTLNDYPRQRHEPVRAVHPSDAGTGLNTQKKKKEEDKITSKVKIEPDLPLKPAAQLNDYGHMVTMAELQMVETNITLKKKDLEKNNDIMIRINLSSLPDKGKKLQMRSIDLKKELDELEQQKTRLHSQLSNPSNNHTLQPGELAQLKPQPPSWQEIRKTSDVQHGFGVKAMENYYAEKAATLEVLRQLHNSLKTRPEATTLAADPRELRSDVKLMPHQKHALAWMMWRESERPSGGILADDMGLGKTLTMISLLLKCAEENIVRTCPGSDSDDYSKENKASYKSKHRSTKGGTLVVCPASLLSQWEGEVKRRVNRGVLGVEIHHGSNREIRPHRLARHDMVVTTYAIVMNEHARKGPLHKVKWQRIILDEAHTVRNHKSLTSIAVVDLKAHCRWALTGTPIHNKELDLFALLKFLRCSPFDELPVWKKWVDNKRDGGMTRLNTVMNSIMLRRTKEQLQEEKSFDCLPEKNVENIEVKLDTDEFAVYEKVLIFSRALMSEFLLQKAEKDALLNGRAYVPLNFNSMKPEETPFGVNTKLGSMHQKLTSIQDVKSYHILVLLLRLRQICCHPGLIKKMLDQESAEQDGIEDKDGLDIDLVAQINRMSLSEQRGPDFDPDDALSDEDILKLSNPVFNTERASSKMRAVFACLEKNIKGTQDKAVVVSQWPSMLMLMGSHLKEMNIRCSMLTGAVPVKDRPKIVDDFNKVGHGPQVLLLSLTAGGVGLNLIGGNHLLLCDLHWNPQLEAQACDRIYRMGQKKTVQIYKFVCEDTIEQKIKNIQGKKLEIATGILSGAHMSEANKLTLDDLKTIFNL